MLIGMCMIQTKRGIQSNRQPNAVANPYHLPHLAVTAWMSGENFLQTISVGKAIPETMGNMRLTSIVRFLMLIITMQFR